MKIFFFLLMLVGFLWIALEAAAKVSSVAPSMYQTSGFGWLLVIAGIIGEFCIWVLP